MKNQTKSFLKKFTWLGYLAALGAAGWAGISFVNTQKKLDYPTPMETLTRVLTAERGR